MLTLLLMTIGFIDVTTMQDFMELVMLMMQDLEC